MNAQYNLATLICNCTTTGRHYISLDVQTKEIYWITNEPNYFLDFDACPGQVAIEQKELIETLKTFLILNGLVFNPEEGDDINQKSKNVMNASLAMYKSSKTGSSKISNEDLKRLKQGDSLETGNPILRF